MWAQELNRREEHIKRSNKGKLESATYSQTKAYLQPLLRKLNKQVSFIHSISSLGLSDLVSSMAQIKKLSFKIVCVLVFIKTLETISNCQNPVFSLAVSQHMHKITNL